MLERDAFCGAGAGQGERKQLSLFLNLCYNSCTKRLPLSTGFRKEGFWQKYLGGQRALRPGGAKKMLNRMKGGMDILQWLDKAMTRAEKAKANHMAVSAPGPDPDWLFGGAHVPIKIKAK